jgi:hypothetical protein
MKPNKSTPPMSKNSMMWFKRFVIGVIISFPRSFCCTQTMNHLSTIHSLMSAQFVSFDLLKRDYSSCKDFSIIYAVLMAGQRAAYSDASLHEVYFFKRTWLFLLNTSVREHKIHELHFRVVVGHFGRDKIITMVEDWHYWLSLK